MSLIRFAAGCAVLYGLATPTGAQEVLTLKRSDSKDVAVSAYLPTGAACKGWAVISPGAGGSETGYHYLGAALSSLGYLAVVVGHQESGRRAVLENVRGNGIRAGLEELITEPEAYRARFLDIAASGHWARARCASSMSILIGHSMGAATTLMEAGAKNKVGIQGGDSFSAYVAISPQGAGIIFPVDAWEGITKPVLLLTGTRDNELGGVSWEVRTEPFRNMRPGCKWLGVVDGATHMNFAGLGASRRTEARTAQAIGAFLEGVTRGECSPKGRIAGVEVTSK
jgi:predicted dienelactone hydrolase